MTEEQNKRCEDNIAFVNSFFQQFSDFRGVLAIWVTKQEKDLAEKTAAISVLFSEITRLDRDSQKLMSEMIRLAKAVENTQKDLTEFKVFFINHKPTVTIPGIAKTVERKNWKFWV